MILWRFSFFFFFVFLVVSLRDSVTDKFITIFSKMWDFVLAAHLDQSVFTSDVSAVISDLINLWTWLYSAFPRKRKKNLLTLYTVAMLQALQSTTVIYIVNLYYLFICLIKVIIRPSFKVNSAIRFANVKNM